MARASLSSSAARVHGSAAERLDSWKEIASYLKRSVRTARRWERAQGLPVHRHDYLKRGLVYAYKSELDAWWDGGRDSGSRVGSEAADRAATPTMLVAVLPFESLDGGPGDDHFTDGLTAEVITQLGRLCRTELGIIARASVMQYSGSRKDASQIGSELGVGYLVEGSVRQGGQRLRVSVDLVEARTQVLLWAYSYDREIGDVLTLQSDLGRAVAAGVLHALRGGRAVARARP